MKNQRGQILVETLIALGVVVIIIAATTTIVISSLNNALFAKNQDLASGYAKQGMETVRNMAKTNWIDFLDMEDINYCLDKNSATLSASLVNGCGQNVDNFKREIAIDHDSHYKCTNTNVVVSVSWIDGKCTDTSNLYCHKVELESCFSDVNNLSQ